MGEGKPLGLPEQGRENPVVTGSVGSDRGGRSRPGLPILSQASPTPSQQMQEDLEAQADLKNWQNYLEAHSAKTPCEFTESCCF